MRQRPDHFITRLAGAPMDVLSSVLRELRLDSASYRVLVLRAPWRLRFDGRLRGVHNVVRGRCVLRLDDVPAQSLGSGDLVVLPRADSHTLHSIDGANSSVTSSLELARRAGTTELAAGGTGEETRIVCGAFFLGQDDHPAVAGLPACIHVPGAGRSCTAVAGRALHGARRRSDGRRRRQRSRHGAAVGCAGDARATHHLEAADGLGWLQGLRDPYISRALAALHADLGGAWTVASLARAAGLSRAAFAARFTRTVGRSPIDYVLHCRMRRAMAMLRVEQATVAKVASQVGYGSEAALSAAFVRHTGMTPGSYRRQPVESTSPGAGSAHEDTSVGPTVSATTGRARPATRKRRRGTPRGGPRSAPD
jgi:AraC-like DNA-binding protein